MGESAALKAENIETSPATKDEADNNQHKDLDEAIKKLSGVDTDAMNPSTEAISNPGPGQGSDPDTKSVATPAVNPITNRPSGETRSVSTSAPIWDIPVDVNIVMGSAELTVARLMELENGDVVELNRRVGEPLDIAVNGQNIAKGKIVMHEDDKSQFAIQITELVGR